MAQGGGVKGAIGGWRPFDMLHSLSGQVQLEKGVAFGAYENVVVIQPFLYRKIGQGGL